MRRSSSDEWDCRFRIEDFRLGVEVGFGFGFNLKSDICPLKPPVHEVPIDGELDLHAFSPHDIPSVVDEYVSAAAAAGLAEVRLIHGRGRGVQRGIVQAALDRHPFVLEFCDDMASQLGATIARLKRP
jgi:dsDNA-specific endonuclease/ATPase MutS2